MTRFLANLAFWFSWMVVVTIATFVVGYLAFPQPVRQPLAFNHAKHQDIDCAFCHEGAAARRHAGLPAMDICLMCHDSAPSKVASEIDAWNLAVANGRMPWRKILRMRDHVYFSHQRHVEMANLECKVCHGDMAARTTPPSHPLVRVDMDVCMDCHLQKKVSNDCARCHK